MGEAALKRALLFVAVTALILAFALATGFPVFHRTFYVLALLLLFGFAWAWVLMRGVEVSVHRGILRARAGQSVSENVTVRGLHRFVRGFIEIQEKTDMNVPAPRAVVSVSGAGPVTIELHIPCPRRGLYKIGPLEAAGSDPFGLFRMRRSAEQTARLMVHPNTVELSGFVLLPADLPGEGPVHLRSQNVTPSAFGVRDYVAGDTLNRISWKATARFQNLMVKEFEVEPSNNIWVLLDLDRHAYQGPALRAVEETCISVAASICKRYVDSGYPVGFVAAGNEKFFIPPHRGPDHLLKVLDALAELHPQGDTSLLNLIADLHSRAGRYTSVALVTPSINEDWLDGIRHLLQSRSRTTAVIVDGQLGNTEWPDVAYRAAALNVPVYAVKAGAEARGLTSLTHGSTAYGTAAAAAPVLPGKGR